jgi:Beta-lactamase enzyme family
MRRVGGFVSALLVVGLCGVSGAQPTVAKRALSAQSTCHVTAPTVSHARPLKGVCKYLQGREGVVQVALYDRLNGKTYVLSNGSRAQYTASIVKVDVLAMWLRSFIEQRKKIPAEIPYSIKYLAERMIEASDNAAATGLFYFGGGCHALTTFNSLIPLKATDVGCESANYYGWGNTTTTAADQVDLMKVFAYGKPHHVLVEDARAYGLDLMEHVQSDQRWGITCGPWGTSCSAPDYAQPVSGVTVALKNGWKTLPTCSQPIPRCPWQVNSTGWVKGAGRNYVLTVLTTEDPVGTGDLFGFNYGIETIQGVSSLIWSNLA